MKTKPNTTWMLILITALILLQACALSVDPTPTLIPPTEVIAPPPSETPTTAPTPTLTPTPDPTAQCPTPNATSSLYLSKENGFCFLYPIGFTLQPDSQRPNEALILLGPVEPGTSQERLRVTLNLAYNGPADGLGQQRLRAALV